jgi:phosphoribosylamine--glycine ligase
MMHVLVVGSGAREHAIAKALTHSKHHVALFCCGSSNNPGIKSLSKEYWIGDVTDVAAIVAMAKHWHITLAIIGPEAPLEAGLADALWDCGIPVVGPTKRLAQIESSKTFARDLMKTYAIAGLPKYQQFSSIEGVAEFLEELGETNFVIKADGLMGGKGVKVAGDHLHSFQEALAYCAELFAQNQPVLIEEKLIGQEFSLMCFSDGTSLAFMPIVQDHKRAYENDSGPNTGGMGSYSDVSHSLPFLTGVDVEQAFSINQSVIKALMTQTQQSYKGILYGGFIATAKGVYVIEFNARFGDPEALNVLSILDCDFLNVCNDIVAGTLNPNQIQFANKATVCTYAVPDGYPDRPLRDCEIAIQSVAQPAQLYLSGVDERDGKLYATGSRTAAFVGVAETLQIAQTQAEEEICQIKGPLFHRKDIGTSVLIQQRIDFMRKLRST